jgi:signal transduction histidine kinase/integral membrane sensor domain MASE1
VASRRDLVRLALLTALYVAAGRLGLMMALSIRQISPVWPPTGLALFALFVGGRRLWPAVLVGAFLVNLPAGESVPTALTIAAGNTLEAVAGATLLRRFRFDHALERLRDVFSLLLAAGAATAISATVGVLGLWMGGLLSPGELVRGWWVWWVGDVMGALAVAPFLFTWQWPLGRPRPQRLAEGLLLYITLSAATLIVFALDRPWSGLTAELQYVVFPFLIWAALRFGQRQAARALVLVSAIAIWATLHDRGPFGFEPPETRLLLLQVFMAVVGVTTLALAAVTAERRRAQEALEQARTAAERSEQQASVLAEASALMAASIDYEATLQAVSRAAVPRLADWCVVDVIDPDGRIDRVAATAASPARQALLQEIHGQYPPTEGSPQPATAALRTRRPVFYREVDLTAVLGRAQDAQQAQIIAALDPRSVIAVPMLSGEALLGAITLAYAESDRRYDAADVATAEELARRAAVAVEHARLFRQAQDLNRAKDAFLATLSHELRTPLTPILGWTRLLRDQAIDEVSLRKGLEVIDRNVRLQTQLIDDLLDMSRILAGKIRLFPRPQQAAPILLGAVDTLRANAEAKSLPLETHLDAAVVLQADPERLQQVMTNLVSNAIKFTAEGHVEVHLRETGGRGEILVRDTGEGVPPEFLPRMFRPFTQADGSTTRAHPGLGLGLAIVREIVERHGGSVSAESAGPGQGTTLRVLWPLATGRVVADRDRAPTPPEPPPSLDGVRVLVVDDEEDARQFLATTLARSGAIIRGAPSMTEALRAMDAQAFDVLLSDIGMPEHDGYDLIREVRARPAERGGSLPAIAFTAYAQADDRARALEAGFQVHLSKPVDPGRLVSTVATLVRRYG